jgi:TRAP-type C4-dicarboxylate transport system permease small subunit
MAEQRPDSTAETVLFWIAALALFTTVGIDTAAVVLRQFGRSFPGSTELVQFAIVPSTSAAIILATLLRAHATVHVLVDRAGGGIRRFIARLEQAALLLLFLCLAAASAWLLAETWREPERSDLLLLPIAPLRIVWVLALTIAAALSLRRLFAGRSATDGRGDP